MGEYSSSARSGERVAAAVRSALRTHGDAAAISAVIAVMAISAPVHAQSQTPTTTSLEEVVVTGIRQQLETSQARKQQAEEIVDSITATEIGALPDRSVTEVLQRIPGLAIGRVPEPRDADRIAVEGSGVTVRGLTWVRSELNGRSAFSAKNSRTLGFEDVPPELLAAVDVFKNPSAAMIEGGLSGTVDLRTRLPFDSDQRVTALSAEYSLGDLAEEWRPSGSGLYSDRFDTSIGEIGFLVSLSTSELTSRTNTLHVDKYYERTNLPGFEGQTVFVPGGIGWRELTVDRERTGASAALQWRPNNKVDVSLQYFLSDAKFEQDENAAWNIPGASLTGSNLVVRNGFLVEGDINDGGFQGSSRYNKREGRNQDGALHLTWQPADRWRFDADVQRSVADSQIIDLTLGPMVGPGFQTTNPYHLTLNGNGEPSIVIPANNLLNDPSMYFHGWGMDHHEDNDADAWAYRADGEYTFDNSDWLDRVRFGVRHENFSSTTRETGFRWGSISQNWAGAPLTLTSANSPFHRQAFSDWFHGGAAPSAFFFQNASIFRSYQRFADTVTGLSALADARDAADASDGDPNPTADPPVQSDGGGCCAWVPWDGDYSATNPANDGLGINPQNQQTWAGYGVVSFEQGRLDGNVGVRVVTTEASGQALLKFDTGDLSSMAPPADLAFSNGAAIRRADENSYTDVLPSLNLRYKVQDDLFLRFAVARSMTRPNFPLLLPSITITPEGGRLVNGVCTEKASGDSTPGDCLFRYNGFSGNSDLEPMRSWQYDVTAEWYLSPTNSLTAAVFYKQISGFMETTLNSSVQYTNNGQTRNVRVLRPENQGDGKVQGLEFAYNGFFDFLPGFWKNFGARAAFTYVESSGARNVAPNPFDANQQVNSRIQGYPLEGLSKTSYNAELYYSVNRFEARLAYNWREKYLLTMAAANLNIPAWADDYGQVDASVQVGVTDNSTIGIQAVNLTHEKFGILVDNLNGAGLTPHNWVDADRRYSMFVRVKF
jgi:TonB-dependent receptor